jgi:hypothetical protein
MGFRTSTAILSNLQRLSSQGANIYSNLGQVIVELVIATREPIYYRARYRSFIQIDMRKGRRIVIAAMVEINRSIWRQARS